MLFPFSAVREHQKEFLNDVNYAVSNGRHLIANAPAGLGKTAASLSPALGYALDNGKTVFFLTPRHSQHQIAIETLKKLREKSGTNFQIADIIGKKWLCSVKNVEDMTSSDFSDFCNSMVHEERCRFYENTRNKDRALKSGALNALKIVQGNFYHAEEAKALLASEHCSYEIIMELAKQSNVIIADYYHLFSPARNATLMRTNKKLEDIILIIDEAHNLPDRIRELMSIRITTFSLRKAENEAQMFDTGTRSTIVGIENALNSLRKHAEREAFIEKSEFLELIESNTNNIDAVIDELLSAAEQVREHQKKSFIAAIAKFLESWTANDVGYARILSLGKSRSGKAYLALSHSCLDPALFAKDVIGQSHSTIAMSGTLQPLSMYQEVLGFDVARTDLHSYKSPFPKSNRLNIIVKETTTKYSKRTEENYRLMADYVLKCANSIPGNCAAFFPSYDMRDRIFALLSEKVKKKILLEQRNSNKTERRALYDLFVSLANEGALLLGVQAGSFSEGIDMPGNFLNGVIIVGIPLEKPDLSTKALIDYYDYKFNRGWDYGYTYPAMIRCLQAAGRCIRSESDRGVAVFIDERFLWSNYRKVFPSDMELRVTDEPEKLIREFWQKG